MKKILAIFAIAITSAGVFAAPAPTITLEQRLQQAVVAGDSQAAANWAAAIESLAAAKAANEAEKVLKKQNQIGEVMMNLFKSAPAALDAVEFYNSLQKEPDEGLKDALALGRLLLNLSSRPLKGEELKAVVKKIDDREKAQQRRWEQLAEQNRAR